MANEIETKKTEEANALTSRIATASTYFLNDVLNTNGAAGIEVTEAGKKCGMNAILDLAQKIGVDGLKEIDRTTLNKNLQVAVLNEVDVFSGQCFWDIRKTFNKATHKFSMTPTLTLQGDAYELLVSKFGKGVKTLHSPWLVRDGDEFAMPQHDGLTLTPPVWKPKWECMGNKVVLVVYPLEKDDGTVEYILSPRALVNANLMAHILNNALGADKPSPKDFEGGYRDPAYKQAQDDWKAKYGALRKKLDGKSLDELLDAPELDELISPAWKSPSAKESMIIRKMKKNALMHYVRDLGNRSKALMEADDDRDPAIDEDKVVSEQDGEGEPEGQKAPDFSVGDDGEAAKMAKPAQKEPKEAQGEPKAKKTDGKPSEPAKAAKTPETAKIEVVEDPKEEAEEGEGKEEAEGETAPDWKL